jgi:SAM-dependent methyltransferase
VDFFFELYGNMPKNGPGSTESTLKALRMVPDIGSIKRIIDLGCGIGRHTKTLAENTDAHIVALDLLDEQVEALKSNLNKWKLSERVEVVQGSMGDLAFAKKPFDLIWSESSIYNIGFEEGLKLWKTHLSDGGYLAVSEAVWLIDKPHEKPKAFWDQSYPHLMTVSKTLEVIASCGYEVVGHFRLPYSDWWEGFYDLLTERVANYYSQGVEDKEKLEVLEQTQLEIDVFKEFHDQYGYEFFIMRN